MIVSGETLVGVLRPVSRFKLSAGDNGHEKSKSSPENKRHGGDKKRRALPTGSTTERKIVYSRDIVMGE